MFTISPARSSCLAVLKIIFFLIVSSPKLRIQQKSKKHEDERKEAEKHSKLDPNISQNVKQNIFRLVCQESTRSVASLSSTSSAGIWSSSRADSTIVVLPRLHFPPSNNCCVRYRTRTRDSYIEEERSEHSNPHSPQLKSLVLTYKNLIFPDLVKQILLHTSRVKDFKVVLISLLMSLGFFESILTILSSSSFLTSRFPSLIFFGSILLLSSAVVIEVLLRAPGPKIEVNNALLLCSNTKTHLQLS